MPDKIFNPPDKPILILNDPPEISDKTSADDSSYTKNIRISGTYKGANRIIVDILNKTDNRKLWSEECTREGDEESGTWYYDKPAQPGKTYKFAVKASIYEKWAVKDEVKVEGKTESNTEIDLRNKVQWQSQFDSRFGSSAAQQSACFKACKVILTNAGLSDSSAPNDSSKYQTASENSNHTQLVIDVEKSKSGIAYLNEELEKGYPVLVGVNHTLGKGINEGTTDHFVVIVGRGCEGGKIHYLFYEVGTGYAAKGKSDNNKLYLQDDYSLRGTPEYNTSRNYTVTQIRKNKL